MVRVRPTRVSSSGSRLPLLVASLSLVAFVCIWWWPEGASENYSLLQQQLFSEQRGLLAAGGAYATSPTSSVVIASPFPDLHGDNYEIYHPHQIFHNVSSLLATPETWIQQLTRHYEWLDTRTHGYVGTPKERAISTYLEMMRKHVSADVYGENERSIPTDPTKQKGKLVSLHSELRETGFDWAYLGTTMTGRKRLKNVEELVREIAKKNISGDYVETGVWRGGSSILARATLRSLGESHRRSFVCDSFRGLPPGDKNLDEKDRGWDHAPYLEVSDEQVAINFVEAGVMDPNVIFVKGFFNDTMSPLASKIDQISIMRLDGDMYESTVDVLYHLYEKLTIGGFVIMDDWDNFPSKRACEDFFAVHGMKPRIKRIDPVSVYWEKAEQVEVQHWRYEQCKFRLESKKGGQETQSKS